MDSAYLSEKTKSILWPDFAAHFKSSTSRASYWSDLCEFAQIVEKDITRAGAEDVRRYYQIMTEKVKRGELQPGAPLFFGLYLQREGEIRAAGFFCGSFLRLSAVSF